MSHYINNFQEKINLLEDAEIKIPLELQSIMLLSSLPKEYENFCVAIESRDQIPTVDFLKGKLIEEEARRNERAREEKRWHDDGVSLSEAANKQGSINI